MTRKHLSSAEWFDIDKVEAEEAKLQRPYPILAPQTPDLMTDRAFSDPGHNHGPSIKNPRVYEALRRRGYSKSKAAAISNSK